MVTYDSSDPIRLKVNGCTCDIEHYMNCTCLQDIGLSVCVYLDVSIGTGVYHYTVISTSMKMGTHVQQNATPVNHMFQITCIPAYPVTIYNVRI